MALDSRLRGDDGREVGMTVAFRTHVSMKMARFRDNGRERRHLDCRLRGNGGLGVGKAGRARE